MSVKSNRRIKVQPKYVERRDTHSIYAYAKHYITVPRILLEGKWLQQWGFDPGSHVDIQCEDGKLIISPAKENDD